jgi:Acetyltransferase (GNAT) domain
MDVTVAKSDRRPEEHLRTLRPRNSPDPVQVGVQQRRAGVPSRSHPDSDPCRTARVHFGHGVPLGIPAPDVYFLPGYGRAASVADGGEWLLVEAFDGAWQVPLIMRTLPGGAKDAISPTFSGAYASPSLSSLQIQQAWSATVNGLRERGVISVLLRGSPLVAQAPLLPGLRSIVKRPTIVVEPADEESAWSGMVGTCRTRTRKAIKNGYTGDVRQAEDQDLTPDSDFRRLYEQTMQRLDAASLYFFSEDYYCELLKGVGENLLLAEVRNQEGVVVCSALLMRHAQRLHYHLAGSNMDDARMGVNNLLLWTGIQFATTQGLRQFHLGAGVGLRDSLFHFKRKFGGRELEYGVSGQIIDDRLYQVHTKARAHECGITTKTLLASNFFPAYRGGTTDA